MGLNERLIAKRTYYMDQDGIAPLVAGIILLVVVGGIAIAGFAVYQITQRPDITYNITDTGFSLAGVDMDSLWVIVAISLGLVALWMFSRKKSA